MKRSSTVSLLVLTGLLATACSSSPISTIDNAPPTIALTSTPASMVAGGTVTLTASASDNVGVARVEFYDNGTLIATDTAAPYLASTTYNYASNGTHAFKAVAYDTSNNTAEATAQTTVAIADANEPNDSVAAATAITIGTTVNGAVAAQNRDMDYFKFTAAAGDALKLTVKSVSVNPSSTLDPYVMILMPDGKTVLEKDDDSGVGTESELRFNIATAGTYTIVVTSFDIQNDPLSSDDKATNTYQLALSRR